MNQAQWLAPACAALLSLFYLSQVPVVAVLAAGSGGMGVGIGLFWWRGAIKRARKHAVEPKREKKRPRLLISFRDRRRLFRFILRHGTLEFLRVAGVLALSDAQKTCLAVGAARALCAALGPRGEARLVPAFSGVSSVEAEAVCSMRLMHVALALGMLAGAQSAAQIRAIRVKRKDIHGKIPH